MVLLGPSVAGDSPTSRHEDGDGDRDKHQDGDQDGDSGSDLATDDPITGACFNNDVYHLTVGSARHVFVVHQQILAQSPVLVCMTKSSFSEGVTKKINLPEDNADQFGRLIKYLYGNHEDALDFDSFKDSIKVDKLADLYALAEKYQLPDMQVDITEMLETLRLLSISWTTFFQTAHRICQSTRDSDEIFGKYFTRQAAKHLRSSLEDKKLEELSEAVESGGSFARMAFEVLAKVYREDKGKWSNLQKSTKNQMCEIEQNLKSAKEDKADSKQNHSLWHPKCPHCIRW